MDTWRELFLSQTLLSWEVLGWSLAALLGAGSIALSIDQYLTANLCFVMFCLLCFAKIFSIGVHSTHTMSAVVISFVLYGFVGVGLTLTVRAVNLARDRHSRKGSALVAQSVAPSTLNNSYAEPRSLQLRTPDPRNSTGLSKHKAVTSRDKTSKKEIAYAPNGFAVSGGTVINPIINNNYSPVARLSATTPTQRQTGDPNAPWMTAFTITTNVLLQTGDLRVTCDGPVLRAGISRINPANLSTGTNGPDPEDPNTAVYELGPEMLDPSKEVVIAVYSNHPVKVTSAKLGGYPIVF